MVLVFPPLIYNVNIIVTNFLVTKMNRSFNIFDYRCLTIICVDVEIYYYFHFVTPPYTLTHVTVFFPLATVILGSYVPLDRPSAVSMRVIG